MKVTNKLLTQLLFLLGLLSGCSSTAISEVKQPSPTPSVTIETPVVSVPSPSVSISSSESDFFRLAVNQATNAANLVQSAKSQDQWKQVVTLWQEAINFMKKVPPSHQKYALSQKKIKEYQNNLTYAQRQLNPILSKPPVSIPIPTPQIINPEPSDPYLISGMIEAKTAASLAGTSKFSEDWKVVVDYWKIAIDYVQAVQHFSPDYQLAKNKLNEYKRNLVYAQKMAETSKEESSNLDKRREITIAEPPTPHVPPLRLEFPPPLPPIQVPTPCPRESRSPCEESESLVPY
jgi:hypothetical protein